jgi:FemAB-related protein (PEP-CTERM system-associated)
VTAPGLPNLRIVHADASLDRAWNAFVEASPRASFYHRVEWRDVNVTSFGHRTAYLAALDGDRVVGVFPLVQLKSALFGNLACSLPFVNYGGPAGDTDAIETALLDEAERVCRAWGVDYLEIRSQRYFGERFPSSEHKVSMTVGLDPDPDVIWNSYKAKVGPRQDIKKGYSHGFTATFGGIELLDQFYGVLSETWRDMGTPIYRKDYLRTVIETFPGKVRLCVVSATDGEPAAAALCGQHRDVVEGMWLGIRAKFRRQMVGYVLYWELIKDACLGGFTRFHLGRSTAQSGGEQFKKKWHAEAVQLYWQYILLTRTEIPALNVNNPKYRLAIAAWQKMPVPLTQVIGPFIARSIP